MKWYVKASLLPKHTLVGVRIKTKRGMNALCVSIFYSQRQQPKAFPKHCLTVPPGCVGLLVDLGSCVQERTSPLASYEHTFFLFVRRVCRVCRNYYRRATPSELFFQRRCTNLDCEIGAQASRVSGACAKLVCAVLDPKPPKPPPGAKAPTCGIAPPNAKEKRELVGALEVGEASSSSSAGCGVITRYSFCPHRTPRFGGAADAAAACAAGAAAYGL